MGDQAPKKNKKIKLKKSLFDLDVKDRAKLKAAAVKYDVDKDKAPKLLISGRGKVAEEIVKLAEENNIPLYEDPSLAELLEKLDMDANIPPEMYTLIAEVLAFVYQLDKMAKKRTKIRRKFSKMS